jgi:two-component system, cell cycle response regulator DivK
MRWEGKTVLIAEDEESNYLLLVEYLENTGIKILRARNGHEVIELLDLSIPDVVLLDIKMPFMDGYDVVKLIREKQINLPVIAQTAYVMLGDKEKILLAGCSDYISKPIYEEDLIEILGKYL